MQTIIRYLTVTLIASAFAMSSAIAGECCKTTAEKVKKGETCSKCMKADATVAACCKKAAQNAEKDKTAKACTKCSAKKEQSKS